jgi:hypothetical protein
MLNMDVQCNFERDSLSGWKPRGGRFSVRSDSIHSRTNVQREGRDSLVSGSFTRVVFPLVELENSTVGGKNTMDFRQGNLKGILELLS